MFVLVWFDALRPSKTQFLSTQQCAYQFLVVSWFDSFCVTLARWENFRINIYMNLSYPTTMYKSIFAQMYIFLVEN